MKNRFNISGVLIDKNLPLFIFSVVYYSVIIFLAWNLNIWEDEVYSLNTSSGTLSHAFHQSINFELQPPVYFMSLTLWRTISGSVLWARLLSVVLVVLSQILLYKFARSFSNKKMATAITILFLLSPVTVYVALEIRTFPMVLFLSLLILIYFFETYYRNNITAVKRIIFILISILGIFTQYYIGFLLFANAIVLLMMKNWKSLRLYIQDMILPLVLILLYIPFIQSNVNVKFISVPDYVRTFGSFLSEVKELISQMTFGYFLPIDFIGSRFWHRVLKVAIIISFLISVNYSEIKKTIHDLSPFIVISSVIVLFFIMVLYLLSPYAVEYKYTIIVFIPLLISIMLVFKAMKPGFINFWLIFFALLFITVNTVKYKDLYKVKDFISLGNYIEMNEKEGEPIFVHRNISAENLTYYYEGKNEIKPVPDAFSYSSSFGPEQWKIDENDLDGLNEKLMRYNSFYVVIDNSPLKGVSEAKTEFLEFLKHNYNLLEMKPFKGQLDMYKFSKIIESEGR